MRPLVVAPERTLASRFIILILCLAVVLSTLAFGTVHSWSLAFFQAGAGLISILWAVDAWRTRALRLSRNFLQLPLLGLIFVGIFQLLPLGAAQTNASGLSVAPIHALSLDPYWTKVALVQLGSLFIYFAATLVFMDSPARLRLLVSVLIVFGALLALYGLLQYFLNPMQIYWLRQPKDAVPFGPFINRHHFAGYMELALAVPLGLLFAGAVKRDWFALYAFAVLIMTTALVMTGSRGGVLSLAAEILFLIAMTSIVRRRERRDSAQVNNGRRAALLVRFALKVVLGFALFSTAIYFGGDELVRHIADASASNDVSTGRMQFWRGAWEVIKHHPITGAGLGAFGVAYTRYDTSSGVMRLEQAHNDYLQILADAGMIGGALGLSFIIALYLAGFQRLGSSDQFRRGVALGALAGCTAVLVHSFFDFTLHITSNALLFLVLVALATLNGRVEEADTRRRRHRSRRRHHSSTRSDLQDQVEEGGALTETVAAVERN